MTRFREGDWVKYRSGGFTVTRKVLEVRPDGVLVTGQHDGEPNPHTVDPDHKDVEKCKR